VIFISYKGSVHLVKQFQRRRFLKIDQSETRIACGGHACQWIGTKKHGHHRQFLFLIG
jgi:hypothetical protein